MVIITCRAEDEGKGRGSKFETHSMKKHVYHSWTTIGHGDSKELKQCYSVTNRRTGISRRILIQRVRGGSQPFSSTLTANHTAQKRLHTQAAHIDLQE